MPFPRFVFTAVFLAAVPALAAPAGRVTDKQRYDSCINLAALNPAAALGTANKWVGERGGAPAQHCAAVALVGLKHYAEAAQKLDDLGRGPSMGPLRASLFDQAGNAWMLGGDTGRAVTSFQSALALSANDADLYADLARAQAMQSDWGPVESDLNAALSIQPKRVDLLVLRASARHAQNHIADARSDADAALTLSPRNAEALVERGAIKRDQGDMKGARADFESALMIDPNGATADAAKRNVAALDAVAAKPKKK